MPALKTTLGAIVATAAANIGVASAFRLKDVAEYEVKRDLLEKSYPAFKSFNGVMHAGMVPAALVDESTTEDYSSYFFWLLRPDIESSPSDFRDDTLLVWLNGGPGCSSMTGMLGEMGPVGVPKFGPGIAQPNPLTALDAPLIENANAWTEKTAMLFVEQPGGTGFSTASTEWIGDEAVKRTEDDIASTFYAFLNNVFTIFGENLSKKKLFLSGESYAGMYIPSIARGIHYRNKGLLSKTHGHNLHSVHEINLCGVAIGNGWIDVQVQGPAAIDYAWWHGMIDLQTYRGLHEKMDQCFAGQIMSAETPFHPFTTPNECGINDAAVAASGGNFVYDVTTFDAYPDILSADGTISRFFNDPVVREALNAPSDHGLWQACVPGAGRRRLEGVHRENWKKIVLDDDKPYSVVPYIAELLDEFNTTVLMYSGDRDLAVSAQSTELSLEKMEWSGRGGWMDPDTTKWHQWTVDGQLAGHTKYFKGLTFLVVYNSGHFVPINQPKNSLDMIGRLLDSKPFGDESLPNFPVREKKQSQGEVSNPSPNQHPTYLFIASGGFLLGMLTSHFLFKRSARRSYSPLP